MVARCVQIALEGLVETDDGLRFAPGVLGAVSGALNSDLVDEPGVLEELLRLVVVLRERGPTAGEALAQTLRRNPTACAQARQLTPTSRPLDKLRSFVRREDRDAVVRAPSVSDARPIGAIPASTLVDPTRHDRRRVASRARKEAKHGH